MGGLLNHAKKFLRGVAASTPVMRSQTYSVACPEGHRLTGIRTEGYQALRCPTCGEGIFVLPKSPLPDPPVPAGSRTSGRPSSAPLARAEVFPDFDDEPVALTDPVMSAAPVPDIELDEPEDEVVWDDEPAPAPRFESTPRKGRVDAPEDLAAAEIEHAAKQPSRAPRPKPKPVPAQDKQVVAHFVEPKPRPTLGERFQANRNPLIFAAVGLVVLATIGIRTWRARIADLPRIAERGKNEGLTALDDGKFELAHQILSAAKRAVISLGDQYEGSSAIKQGADEAAAIANLAPASLEDMLDQASRADPAEWGKTFTDLYKGRHIIIHSDIKKVPDGRGKGRYELEYKVLPEGGDGGPPRARGQVDTTGFRMFEETHPRVGDHMIFAAKLASFEYDAVRQEWNIGLVPESGVNITHEKALQAMGEPTGNEATGEGAP